MTTERPILFSAPMVRALLAGAKTQTRRRLAMPEPSHELARPPTRFDFTPAFKAHGGWCGFSDDWSRVTQWTACPYGFVGDRLWVRETLREYDEGWGYAADQAPILMRRDDSRYPAMLSWAHHKETTTCVSIHMPRWASRLTLEITDIRIERLQAITNEDAAAEGMRGPMIDRDLDRVVSQIGLAPRDAYAKLWDTINGKRAPWSSNPWVWVVTFSVAQGAEVRRGA